MWQEYPFCTETELQSIRFQGAVRLTITAMEAQLKKRAGHAVLWLCLLLAFLVNEDGMCDSFSQLSLFSSLYDFSHLMIETLLEENTQFLPLLVKSSWMCVPDCDTDMVSDQ